MTGSYSFLNYSLVNLWLYLEKIATEFLFVGMISAHNLVLSENNVNVNLSGGRDKKYNLKFSTFWDFGFMFF